MTEWILHLERLQTPTGPMLIVTDEQSRLCAVGWREQEERMRRQLRRCRAATALRLTAPGSPSPARRALEAYFDGEMDAVADLQIATEGTDFQRTVWAALGGIPPGDTLSYGALAARIGRPTAVRAVGLAAGANPIAIVIPCHRVLGANATLTGYAGGVERKRWLLEHEGAIATRGSPRAGS